MAHTHTHTHTHTYTHTYSPVVNLHIVYPAQCRACGCLGQTGPTAASHVIMAPSHEGGTSSLPSMVGRCVGGRGMRHSCATRRLAQVHMKSLQYAVEERVNFSPHCISTLISSAGQHSIFLSQHVQRLQLILNYCISDVIPMQTTLIQLCNVACFPQTHAGTMVTRASTLTCSVRSSRIQGSSVAPVQGVCQAMANTALPSMRWATVATCHLSAALHTNAFSFMFTWAKAPYCF